MLKFAASLLALSALCACALDPVESDPAKADQRASAMRQDCYSRGGTWSEASRTCVGADPRR
jgi:hypothetical protein